MTSQGKSSSKWGSFFQQAVAGVESRLDTILAEEDTKSPTPRTKIISDVQYRAGDVSSQRSGQSKSPSVDEDTLPTQALSGSDQNSGNKNSDRLQERLAKALVGRNPNFQAGSSNPVRLHVDKPPQDIKTERSSLESKEHEENICTQVSQNDAQLEPPPSTQASCNEKNPLGVDGSLGEPSSSKKPAQPQDDLVSAGIFIDDGARPQQSSSSPRALPSPLEYQRPLEKSHLDHQGVRQHICEDVSPYLEHIDLLQAKIQYLLHDAIAEARKVSEASESNGFQRQLAQRDEKIAQLIAEGTKLSENELKFLNTIKKLRGKVAEHEVSMTTATRKETDIRNEMARQNEKIKSYENAERDNMKFSRLLEMTQAELHRVTAEVRAKDSYIAELQQSFTQSKTVDVAEETKKWKNLLETEEVKTLSLQEELFNLRTEKDMIVDHHKSQLQDLQARLDREVERNKANELDLKGELQVLESRLETYRTQAEEVSSVNNSDVQVKLGRQIETLQNSYSVASENWREIESSLLSRISVLEREQVESHRKETELRRKARDMSSRNRELELQLGRQASRAQELEDALSQETSKSVWFKNALTKNEQDMEAAKAELKTVKDRFEAQINCDESIRRESSFATGSSRSRAGSSPRRLHPENVAIQSYRVEEYPITAPRSTSAPLIDPSARALSTPASLGLPLYKHNPSPSTGQAWAKDISPRVSTIQNERQDEMFDEVATPTTPERTTHDVFSTSTAAAGPSVQLMERMSAAVRRLESQKATSQDEVNRLSSQRDEARNEVITLMNEIERKRVAEVRIRDMEAEIQELNFRLQTTLEMLGEKSELVEELKADIVDMKEMYRSTLEDAIK